MSKKIELTEEQLAKFAVCVAASIADQDGHRVHIKKLYKDYLEDVVSHNIHEKTDEIYDYLREKETKTTN